MGSMTTANSPLPLLLVVVVVVVILFSFSSFASPSPFSLPRFPSFSSSSSSSPTHNLNSLSRYPYEIKYFTQNLDHFGFASLPTFHQRYLISSEHWAGPGSRAPIFFYCGNEGDVEWFAANTGFVWETAPQFKALVIFAEHRYYGKSMPFGSMKEAYKNAESLSYFTTEQALADFAILITELKQNLTAGDSPVVLFGGSYGGMMAAWMRLKYPHIAVGALASSAPILQFEDIVPYEIFYNIVSNDFKRESLSCFLSIKESWDAIEVEGKKPGGLQSLSTMFHFCRDLKNTEELSDWLSSAWSNLAMVDYPYPSDFLMPLPAYPIKEACRNIDNQPTGTSVLERIFAGVSIYYNFSGSAKCFDLADDPHGMSGWGWQACTEMVMPMSSSKTKSMFPPFTFDYASYSKECFNQYGTRPRPHWITTEFGGHGIAYTLKNFGSNIIFSNGLLDPWSAGSVLQNISSSIVALVTKLGAHHIDLRPATKDDPVWLVEQRNAEIHLIKSWIDSYHAKKQLTFSI